MVDLKTLAMALVANGIVAKHNPAEEADPEKPPKPLFELYGCVGWDGVSEASSIGMFFLRLLMKTYDVWAEETKTETQTLAMLELLEVVSRPWRRFSTASAAEALIQAYQGGLYPLPKEIK